MVIYGAYVTVDKKSEIRHFRVQAFKRILLLERANAAFKCTRFEYMFIFHPG
jgi:hypothetical protein